MRVVDPTVMARDAASNPGAATVIVYVPAASARVKLPRVSVVVESVVVLPDGVALTSAPAIAPLLESRTRASIVATWFGEELCGGAAAVGRGAARIESNNN